MNFISSHPSVVMAAAWQHIVLVGTALLAAVVIAVPVGVLVTRFRPVATPVLGFLGLIYTIPSLALLALLVPLEGLGFWTAVTALAAYAQLILVRNIAAGITSVDAAIVEAARGMGMSAAQILWRVQWPLAMPIALGGLRLAAISIIGIGTMAALIDAGGLGTLILAGIEQDNIAKAVAGAIVAAALAMAAEFGLRAIEGRYRRKVSG